MDKIKVDPDASTKPSGLNGALARQAVSTPTTTNGIISPLEAVAFLTQAAAFATATALASSPLLLPVLTNGSTPTAFSSLNTSLNPPEKKFGANPEVHESSRATDSKALYHVNDSIEEPTPRVDYEQYKKPTLLTEKRVSQRGDQELVDCPVCEKTMRRGSLREHMDRHTNGGKYECSTCKKKFSRAIALEKHIRTHTGERPFKCEYCDKTYRQKVHLNEHIRVHTGDRPYVCHICGFAVTSKSMLNRHVFTHRVRVNNATEMWLKTDAPREAVVAASPQVGRSVSGLHIEGEEDESTTKQWTALHGSAAMALDGRKQLCCDCPAGFPTAQALRSHRMLAHGVDTNHKCETCQEAYPSIKALRTHVRQRHPQLCPVCSEEMPQRRRCFLEVHIRDEHPDVSIESIFGSTTPTKPSENKRKKRKPQRYCSSGLEDPMDCNLIPPSWKCFKETDADDDNVDSTVEFAKLKSETMEMNEVSGQ